MVIAAKTAPIQPIEIAGCAGKWLTCKDAAQYIGVSRQRVHQLAQDGRIEKIKIFSNAFYSYDNVRAYAESERKAGNPHESIKGR